MARRGEGPRAAALVADTAQVAWALRIAFSMEGDRRRQARARSWPARLLGMPAGRTAETVECTGVPLATVIDYMPLPLLWEYCGLSFVALQTRKAPRAEGAAMRHCVASYWRSVVKGGSRIYSIRKNGSRDATLELAGPSRRRPCARAEQQGGWRRSKTRASGLPAAVVAGTWSWVARKPKFSTA